MLASIVVGTEPASARSIKVGEPGVGDVETIQDGVDLLYKSRLPNSTTAPYDTIVVPPGAYAEDLVLPEPRGHVAIVATAGVGATSIRSVRAEPRLWAPVTDARGVLPMFATSWRLDGFRIDAPSDATGPYSLDFARCAFTSPIHAASGPVQPAFTSCDFHADVIIEEICGTAFLDCRFFGATLRAIEGTAAECSGSIVNCQFIGPVDTAAIVRPNGETVIQFDGCSFREAGYAIVGDPVHLQDELLRVDRCVFEQVSGIAIDWFPTDPQPDVFQSFGLVVLDSRFDHCSRAIRWGGSGFAPVAIERDTILDGSGTAIEVSDWPWGAFAYPGEWHVIRNVTIERNGGGGILLRTGDVDHGFGEPLEGTIPFMLDSLAIRQCSGPAVTLERVPNLSPAREVTIRGGVLLANAEGVVGTADALRLEGTVIGLHAGRGLDIALDGHLRAMNATNNTIVGSLGRGLRVSSPGGSPIVANIRNNLVSHGRHDGVRIECGYAGSVACNDAWANDGSAYAGVPPDSNLTLDPLFCDRASGLFTLAVGSPCGPSGPHGRIGAFGEGCPTATDARPIAIASRATIRPNPARGAVAFELPWEVGEGTVEVFDVQGRRLWKAAAPAGAPLRWDGVGEGGAIRAGLYWVRIARGTDAALHRMVWLE